MTTVEIDDKALIEHLVSRMNFAYEAGFKEAVQKEIQAVIIREYRERIKAEAARIVETVTLPDGRTFKDYVRDLMLRPGSGAYAQRPRAMELIDNLLNTQTKIWFEEILGPHIEALREGMLRRLIERLTKETSPG